MKIICTKNELLHASSIVIGAVSQKSTLPLLSNLLFEAKDNSLIIAATDLEVSMKTVIKAQVIKEGGITLPGKLLVDIFKKMPQDEIEITSDEQCKVIVKSGRTKYSLIGISKDEFPVAIGFDTDNKLKMKGDILKDMILKTKFAISMDETRYVLNGIDFIIDKGLATMVATDGKRLTMVSRKEAFDKKLSLNFIIPLKAVEELLKILLNMPGEEVEIGVLENQIGFKIKETILRSRLIDGHFPNYEQVIPKETKGRFKVKTKDLLAATERVSLVASGKAVPVKFSLSENKLSLYVMEQGKGEGNDEVEADYKGEPFEAAYNPNYIIDMLKVVNSQEVVFEFSSSINPGVIKPADDADYIYIIMPMRLD